MALLFLNVGNAYGQDSGQASNASDGTSTTGTGDAGATGNQANTDSGQGAAVQGHNGSIHVVRQSNTVNNAGVAVANTGGNTGAGNTTNGDMNAVNGQLSAGGGIANNSGRASNSSNGTSTISTGDANAVGNQSNTDITQVANVNAVGGLGAIVVVTQDATVNNLGVAVANTGQNTAAGNTTNGDFNALNLQGALAFGSIANNSGAATNNSNGTAGIDTGDANAVGNQSSTGVTQIANVNAGGTLGGLVVVQQRANVNNIGVSVANTGGNTAVGNTTNGDFNAATAQLAGAGSILGPPGTEIASNDGIASNNSNGTAGIRTGNATGVGNRSSTHITQQANTYLVGGGFVVTPQTANVNNLGVAVTNTGLNTAVGNVTNGDFLAVAAQAALALSLGGAGDDTAIAGNFGSATNHSDGTAGIDTGNASANGNVAETSINQSANASIEGTGFIVPIQTANVNNFGVGVANTGLNAAIGNVTNGDFIAVAAQLALSLAGAAGDDVAVAGNFGQATNWSNGTALIRTGSADATGNDSKTWINQSSASYIGGGGLGCGFIVPVQRANVNNLGVGVANSGLNLALGNFTNGDFIAIPIGISIALAGGAGDDVATSGNFGQASNTSNGTARIASGNATATGNKSETAVGQSSSNYIGGSGGFIVPVQTANVNNIGVGIANSGANAAVGNITNGDFFAITGQLGIAAAFGTGDDTAIAGNFGTAQNSTDGTAEITTGDACAAGNNSTTYVTQNAASGIDGSGFIVPIQTANVNNLGVGIANSGLNAALGNLTVGSFVALTLQAAAAVALGSGDDLATASNDGVASNWSNGTARIRTGLANAEGNRSATGVTQNSSNYLAGVGFVVPVQRANVNNLGVAVGNSGLNAAVGNVTLGDFIAVTPQLALALEIGGGDDVALANNTAASTNNSNGTAGIETGDACAAGNVSATVVNQNAATFAPFASFIVTLQDANILNAGVGIANSGLNGALGNLTNGDFIAVSPQLALALSIGGGDDLAIANNAARNSNNTNGSAGIKTGSATATGNWATNGVSQEANSFGGGPLNITVQDAPINNLGVGLANTGLNAAQGNLTNGTLLALGLQLGVGLAIGGGDDLGIANNAADTSNSTNGTSAIATGNATAVGNQTVNNVCQATNGFCPDLAFPPLPEPLCPCHKKPEVPQPTPEVPEDVVPGVPGEQLPVTGGPLAAQLALGLLLVALGSMLKRRNAVRA